MVAASEGFRSRIIVWHLGKSISSSVGTVAPERIEKPGEISCNQCPSPAECRAPREGKELRYCTDTPFPALSFFSPPPSNTSLAPAVIPLLTVAHVPLYIYPSGNFQTMQISPKPRALPCKAPKINVNLFLVFCLQWIRKSQWQSFY